MNKLLAFAVALLLNQWALADAPTARVKARVENFCMDKGVRVKCADSQSWKELLPPRRKDCWGSREAFVELDGELYSFLATDEEFACKGKQILDIVIRFNCKEMYYWCSNF